MYMKKVKNGSSYEKNGWLYISIWGEPKERGKAYGYLIADEFKKIQKMLRFVNVEESGITWDYYIESSVKLFKDTIKTHFYEFYEEMEGIAEGLKRGGVETSLDEVIAWNNYYSTESYFISQNSGGVIEGGGSKKGQRESCSAFICVGDWTKDGKIVAGHNNFSNFIDGQFAKQVLDINPTKGNRMLIQGFIGFIWSGTDFFLSNNGIFGTETTIGGFNKFENNYPISCRIRKAMQYGKTLDDYENILIDNNSGDYANSWLFADINTNEIMRLELGLKYHNTEKTKNGYFIGFNSTYDPYIRNLECVDSGFNDVRRHQGARKVRLYELMEKYKGSIDVEIGKKIMSDHYDVYLEKENPCSRTICSHYDNDPREFMSDPSRPLPFQPRGSLDGNLVDTEMIKNMGMLLKFGRSCDIPFDKNEFFEAHPQWSQYEPYIESRKAEDWTYFTILTKGKKNIRCQRTKNKKNVRCQDASERIKNKKNVSFFKKNNFSQNFLTKEEKEDNT